MTLPKFISATLPLGLALCLTLAGPASAQAQRVGVVSMASVMAQAKPAKELKARFEREFSAREKALSAQGDALKTQTDKFEAEAPTLPEAQRNQRRAALVEQSRDFQNKRETFLEDRATAQRNDTGKMLDMVRKVVTQVAEAGKFDLVVQNAVYAKPAFDITDKVIAGLNSLPTP